jgi:hypothetical protein
MKSGYRSIPSAYQRLHVPNYCPWVASHPRLLHYERCAEPKRLHSAWYSIALMVLTDIRNESKRIHIWLFLFLEYSKASSNKL